MLKEFPKKPTWRKISFLLSQLHKNLRISFKKMTKFMCHLESVRISLKEFFLKWKFRLYFCVVYKLINSKVEKKLCCKTFLTALFSSSSNVLHSSSTSGCHKIKIFHMLSSLLDNKSQLFLRKFIYSFFNNMFYTFYGLSC